MTKPKVPPPPAPSAEPAALTVQLPEALTRVPSARWQDTSVTATCPLLAGLLSPQKDSLGRLSWEGASISLRVEGASMICSIRCPTARVQTTLTIHTLGRLAEEIEAALASADGLAWGDDYKASKKQRAALDAVPRPMV